MSHQFILWALEEKILRYGAKIGSFDDFYAATYSDTKVVFKNKFIGSIQLQFKGCYAESTFPSKRKSVTY